MKIDHIQLAIPENSDPICRSFWINILGFEELKKPEVLHNRGGAWFRYGNVEVHLGVEKNFRQEPHCPDRHKLRRLMKTQFFAFVMDCCFDKVQ